MNRVASIGTSDSRNVAGVGRDARVAADYGVQHGMAIVAVSAQDEGGLRALATVPTDVVRAQLEALSQAAAYRVGALVSSENVQIVAQFLRNARVPVVFDPVVTVTLGGELRASGDLVEAMRRELLALPWIVTPNLDEAEMLLQREVRDVPAMCDAARRFLDIGASAAIVKGGHLQGDPVDVFAARGREPQLYTDVRLPRTIGGTGCTFAAALACELALGAQLPEAVRGARNYVRTAIQRATASA